MKKGKRDLFQSQTFIFSPTVYKKVLAVDGPNHLNLLTKSLTTFS